MFSKNFCASVFFISYIKENNDAVHYNNETLAKAELLFKLVDDFEFTPTCW